MKRIILICLCLVSLTSWAETRVEIRTNLGAFVVALDTERAPKTSENFLRYVNSGFYEGIIFHRVINGFILQAGRYNAELKRKMEFPPIAIEAGNGLLNTKYTFAMMHQGERRGSTGQFFVNLRDNPSLDGQPKLPAYVVFGKVVSGFATLDAIRTTPVTSGETVDGLQLTELPSRPVVIEKVRVLP